MKKFYQKSSAPCFDDKTMENIVKELFSTHTVQPIGEDPAPFTVEDLRAAVRTIGNRKAPSPDNIPAEILKVYGQATLYFS